MPKLPIKSARGVYYKLELSPFEYQCLNGDILKFSSRKKLEIYNREIALRFRKYDKLVEQLQRVGVPIEDVDLVILEKQLYKEVEK